MKKVELQFFGNSFGFMQTGVVLITTPMRLGKKGGQNETTLRVDVGGNPMFHLIRQKQFSKKIAFATFPS